MRLKSIKLSGFKSFVDPTKVDFPKAKTAVVGPNGCGKSNIIDAVRWVLGESSAKYLRGESMADVIFNGSSKRPPLAQASIELHFDNSDGRLGGQYASYNEIVVRRQVTRDGQSNYYLNGARCRRKDIMDVFLGTGLGPRSYAIIEQGTISYIVGAKPEELRVFIEEAAGISKYKERRKETGNRIEQVRDNLNRLQDIRDELQKQLSHLDRQAKSAERYKVLKAEERLRKAELHVIRGQQLMRELGINQQKIAEQQDLLTQKQTDLVQTELQHDQAKIKLEEAQQQFAKAQEFVYQLDSALKQCEQSLQHAKQREQQLQQDLVLNEQQQNQLSEHKERDQQRISELTALLAQLQPELLAQKETVQQLNLQSQQADEQYREWQNAWQQLQEKISTASQSAQLEQSHMQHAEQNIAQQQKRRQQLAEEQAKLTEQLQNQSIVELEKTLQEAAATRDEAEQQLQKARSAIEEKRQQVESINNELNDARQSLQKLQGQISALETLQSNSLGQSQKELQDWLSQQGLQNAPKLATKITVEPAYEKALEAFLGECLQAWCVDDWTCVADIHLPADAKANLTLISTQDISTSSLSEDGALLASKVKGPKALQQLLAKVYVSEDLPSAQKLLSSLPIDALVVTQSGIILGQGWLKLIGKQQPQAGVLQRQRELQNLQAEFAEQKSNIENLTAKLQNAREGLQTSEEFQRQANQQWQETQQKYHQHHTQLQVQRSRQQQLDQRYQQLTQELTEIAQAEKKLTEDYQKFREVWQKALQDLEALQAERDILSSSQQSIREQNDQQRQLLRQEEAKLQQLNIQEKTSLTEQHALSQQQIRLEEQLQQLVQRKQELNQALQEATDPTGSWMAEREELVTKRHQADESLRLCQQQVAEDQHNNTQLEQTRRQLEQTLQQLRDALSELKLAHENVQTRLQALQEQLVEQEMQWDDIVAQLAPEANEAAWQEIVQDLARKIERLGAINLAAIEEFQTQSERKDFLDRQHLDLTTALETLEDAIRTIDRETKTRFQETFDTINTSFQKFFPQVFGGGKANLEFTGDDLLTTGVAVFAQPPGKRNSTIHLLSGGEKALTAVALVFAIFELNPAPFCMLDEVDAPLDDANVGRFCQLVDAMSEKTQFIMVTHNKVAMEIADHLIGVTMHEPGVSRLVSVDIDQAAALAA